MNLRTQYTTWQEAVRAIVTQLLTMFARARDWTGIQTFTNGLAIGSGATIDDVLTATATLDFASIAAGASETLTITVTGAAVGDAAIASAPAGFEDGLVICCWVSAANTVSVRVHNVSAGAIDPASGTWRATVISFA